MHINLFRLRTILTIILLFSSSVFSTIYPPIDAKPIIHSVENAPVTDGFIDISPLPPASRPLGENIYSIPLGTSSLPPHLISFCDSLRYDVGEDALWEIYPSGTTNDDFLNVRYTTDENFSCTLKTFWLSFYGKFISGTPDMMAYLWDDDGFGYPGTALDSILIPFDSLPTNNTWLSFDFYNSPNAPVGGWVFADGEEYHYGVRAIGDVGDVITLAVDDGSSGSYRTSFWDNSANTWGTLNGVYGSSYMMIQSSEYCAGELPYSDCYTQKYWKNFSNIFSMPHSGGADIFAHAMRFDVNGPDTLKSVDIAIYNANDGHYGDNDIIVSIVESQLGLPSNIVLYTTTLVAGSYTNSMWLNVPVNIVIDQTFHVVVEVLGTPGVNWEYLGADDGENGTGRSSTLYNGTWSPTGSIYGYDFNFLINANICNDPFAECAIQSFHQGDGYGWRFPSSYRKAAATNFTGLGLNCQVKEVSVMFDNYYADSLQFTHNTKISVYNDIAGEPGVELASVIITPSEYVFWPASQIVDFTPLDVFVQYDYWIVVEPEINTTYDSGIYIMSDIGSYWNEKKSYVKNTSGSWEEMYDLYGTDYGWVISSSHCCIPWGPPPSCHPESDPGWATYRGSQSRAGASQLSLGDAWCNLNLNWANEGSNQISFTGPVIYGDKIVCSYGDHYKVIDITDGSILYTLNSNSGDGFLIGSGISLAPTIVNLDGTDIMYIGGGSTLGVGAIDFNTGNVIWQNTIISGNIFGRVSYSAMILLSDGTTDILYYTTDNGKVVALNALTGEPYTGWNINPISLSNNTFTTGTTDGVSLYYGTYNAIKMGNIFSIDAFTGKINWTLSSQGGLMAANQPGHHGFQEGFPSGVVYDDGILYAISWANDLEINDYPIDGYFYGINAYDGTHAFPPVATNRVGFEMPTVDDKYVFAPTHSQWELPTDPTGGNLIAFNKYTGIQVWGAQTPDNAKYYGSGVLTCEENSEDLFFVFNSKGFLECYHYETGDQIFSRRVDHDGSEGEIGLSGAIAQTETDGIHMVFNDHYGGLYDFKIGSNRPRLEIQTYKLNIPVEYGSNPNLQVNAGSIIVNTGCTPLTFSSVLVDENPITVSHLPEFSSSYVSSDIMERADAISDAIRRDAFLSKFKQVSTYVDLTSPQIYDKSKIKEGTSTSFASGIPSWFVSVDQPTIGSSIYPGDTLDLIVTLNQPLLHRGPQSVYISFESNDYDYFLNSSFSDGAGKLPEIKFTVNSGCFIDTTTLIFGMNGANYQLVTNSGRLGTGDWNPHGFEIDGIGEVYYQGSYIYGNSKYSLALNTQDWSAGGGEANSWTSMQADPNYCDNSCKPSLSTSVPVGAISSDGLVYTPISADLVCKTYIDSVENFDTDPNPSYVSWDWTAFDIKSFNDSLTLGLKVNTRTIGATNIVEIANLTLEIMEFTEQNGNEVNYWYLAQIADYDLGGDVATFDQSISTAWAYNQGGEDAWGSIKIPFGCGTISNGQDFNYEPLRSVKGLDGSSALFDGNAYLDSAYTFMRAQPGTQLPTQLQGSDFEMHTTYAAHNFTPNGSFSIGIANFGLNGLSDNNSIAELAEMAKFVNKWAGFGRGDVNNDDVINLADIIYLAGTVNTGPGAIPFAHLSDVNIDGYIDANDIIYLVDYYFNCGPCPMGDWMF